MYRLIEPTEKISQSLPVVGAHLLALLNRHHNKMSLYELIQKNLIEHPDYGHETINQALIFLFIPGIIHLRGAYIEVTHDHS